MTSLPTCTLTPSLTKRARVSGTSVAWPLMRPILTRPHSGRPVSSTRKTSSISSLRSSLGRKRSAMFSDSGRGSERSVDDASSSSSALDGTFLPSKALSPPTEPSQTSSNPGRSLPPSLSYPRCRPRHSRKPLTPYANSMKSRKLILV